MNRLAALRPQELISKISDSAYAYAMWKLPNDDQKYYLISLSAPEQTTKQLSELSSGFVINRFADSHPVKPFFLPADILIHQDTIQIDPSVNAQLIDKLLADFDSAKPVENAIAESNQKTNFQANTYEEMVSEAVAEILSGKMEKVVLARYRDEAIPDDFSVSDFFGRICQAYPAAFCCVTHLPGEGIWACASPELLLSDDEETFKTIALAGTKKVEPNQHLGEIAWTQKEIEEQALVSRYIINCFKKIRLREFEEHGPKTVQAGHLAHLKTIFSVEQSALGFENLADQMLDLLHPTSAVCGMPLEASKQFIESHELFDRSFYSGFLGPVNIQNNTHLFVNLRTVRITAESIRFYAGAGITEDSMPEKELAETEMKMGILKKLID